MPTTLAAVFGQPAAWVDGRWFYPTHVTTVTTRKARRMAKA